MLTTTVVILNWTNDETKEIGIKTRKQLTMSINFHPKGDIDKKYLPREGGGRGIRRTTRMSEITIISKAQYIKTNKSENNILDLVYTNKNSKKL